MSTYNPTIDRTTLLEGPAHIRYDATHYLWCEGPVALNLVRPVDDFNVPGIGAIDSRRVDEIIEAVFSPAGNIPATVMAWLIGSLGGQAFNTSMYGAADTPIVVHALDGTMYTITCGAISEIPTLLMGKPNKRWSGSAKVTGVIGKGLARTAAGALYARTAGNAFTTMPATAEFVSLPVNATWGTYAFGTVDGWKVNIKPKWSVRKDPNIGTFDFRLVGIEVEAQCRPLNLSDTLLQAAEVVGASAAIGASRTSHDLTLAENNPGLTVVLKNAQLVNTPVTFGQDEPRLGELTWRAFRDLSTGFGNLFTVAMTAVGS